MKPKPRKKSKIIPQEPKPNDIERQWLNVFQHNVEALITRAGHAEDCFRIQADNMSSFRAEARRLTVQIQRKLDLLQR